MELSIKEKNLSSPSPLATFEGIDVSNYMKKSLAQQQNYNNPTKIFEFDIEEFKKYAVSYIFFINNISNNSLRNVFLYNF